MGWRAQKASRELVSLRRSELPASAITAADGSYKLRTNDPDGALPGAYSATVSKTDMPPALTKEVSMEDAAK